MAKDGQYRLLHSSISTSKKMRSVSFGCQPADKWRRIGCHLVYTWLIPWGDDDGIMRGEPLWVLANILPNEGLTIEEIAECLQELHRVNLIYWYEVDGEKFIQIVDNEEHQNIRKDRYKKSGYPGYGEEYSLVAKPQPNDNQVTDNLPQIDNPLSLSSSSSTPTSSPSPSHSRKRKSAAKEYSAEFESFWNAYPVSVSKDKAWDAWNRREDRPPLEVILEAISVQKEWRKNANGAFRPEWKHPATWINQGCWNDRIHAEDFHPLAGTVSAKTIKTVEMLDGWRPPA